MDHPLLGAATLWFSLLSGRTCDALVVRHLRRRAKDLFAANPTVRSPILTLTLFSTQTGCTICGTATGGSAASSSRCSSSGPRRFGCACLFARNLGFRAVNRVRSFLQSSTCKDSRIERRWGTVPAGDRVYLSGTHIGMGRGPIVASRNAASTPQMGPGAAYS